MAKDGVIQITTKIGIDGERDYREAIRKVNLEQKVLASEMKKLTAIFQDNADSEEALRAKQQQLTNVYALLEKKLETIKQAFENATKEINDGGKTAAAWQIQMNNVEAEMANVRHEIEQTSKSLAELEEKRLNKLRDEALAQLDGQLGVISEKLKLNTARYRDNANSIEALTERGELLSQQQLVLRQNVGELNAAYERSKIKSGALSEETLKWERRLIATTTSLQETKNAIANNNAALEEALNPTQELTQAAEELEVKSGGLGDQLNSLTEKIGITLPASAQKYTEALNAVDVGTVALVGTGVKLVKNLIDCSKSAAQTADNLLTLSVQTGLTTTQLQELEYASELVDVSVDQITDAMRQMINSMREGKSGTSEAAKAYKQLGVKITDAQGNLRDSQEVFDEVILRLSRMRNTTERSAIAMKIFGESANNLNPIIEDGGKKLKQLREEAHEMGYVMSDETLASLGALDDAMQRFDNTAEAVKNQMALALLPILTNVLDIISAIPPGVLSTVTIAVTLITTIAAAAKALKAITAVTDVFGISATKTLGTILAVVAALIALSAIIAVIAGKGNDLNRAMSSVGNAVGSVQGNVQKAQKTVPHYANGTNFHPGGWALVGENGPEAVMLPRGTRVYTAQETAGMRGGDVYNISINADSVKQFTDIVRIAQNERRSMRMG